LHLRKGVTYHSGREFTSDDVKWNFLRVRDPKLGGSTLGAYSLWWNTIETPDKYTVTLKSEQSRPTLFDSLQLFNMLDQPSMEGPDAKSSAVAPGPSRYRSGSRAIISRLSRTRTTGNPASRCWTALRRAFSAANSLR